MTITRPLILCLSSMLLYVGCTSLHQKTFKPDLPFEPVQLADSAKHPGYAIYMKSCYNCHQQTHPATLSTEKWTRTVPEMAKHAGITEKEGKQVLDYILYLKSEKM